jgi:hypothetical protein
MWSRSKSRGGNGLVWRCVAIASLDGLACGEIDLAPCSRRCIPVCGEIVEVHRVYLSKEGSAYSKARHDHGEIPQSGARSSR